MGAAVRLAGSWRFVEVAGVPLDEGPERAHPSLTFAGDGQVYGTGGVNRLRGTWAMSGRVLTFGPVVTTLMAGTPEHTARERAVLDLLAGPSTVSADGEALLLTDGEGRVSRLLPAPAEDPVV
ncbi:META domain-containing protein [Cellulomonas triticagri]|uniref:META domain-containing protein n=1 Tax=Cellulomonas triticagri TaxID=2483352 RepID=A0A3M2IXH0_9CELL|nr:META domain-containing protein [Cellulomonas triticagri]RMI05164.1 META domain-containing protein [Cellulomonas triticagri]